MKSLILVAIIALATVALPSQAQMAVNDPLEPYNRTIFKVNSVVDYYALEPLAKGYRYVTPAVVRSGIDNFLNNLEAPLTIINSFLQGDLKNAGDTLARFAVNSTFGLAGFYDLAATDGVYSREEDFGQTLAVWGVPSGPYLMLPLFGPSNPRDFFGRAFDGAILDPVDYATDNAGLEREQWIVRGVNIIHFREKNIENINALRQGSQDPYVAIRSAYNQRRQAQIRNGTTTRAMENAFSDAFSE